MRIQVTNPQSAFYGEYGRLVRTDFKHGDFSCYIVIMDKPQPDTIRAETQFSAGEIESGRGEVLPSPPKREIAS